MPERMRVNVGEVVPLGKCAEPCGDPVRDHRLPVFLDKQESGILPAVAVLDLEFHVPAAVLPEQLHCFGGELDKADGSGFGGVLIDPTLCRVKQIGVNILIVLTEIWYSSASTRGVMPAAYFCMISAFSFCEIQRLRGVPGGSVCSMVVPSMK